MSEQTVVELILTGTLLHLTINCSPEGVTAPSSVGADSLGQSRTQLMGGKTCFDGIEPLCCGLGRPLALLLIFLAVTFIMSAKIYCCPHAELDLRPC
jgi:hypothetical protein